MNFRDASVHGAEATARFLGADNDEALRMSASRAQKRQGKKSREVGHWFAREVSEFLRR
jgi:hypothetical protein